MSGGGGSKKKSSSKADKAEAVPAYLGGGVNSTFPQAMPGQLEAIAAQLSAGYGVPMATNLAFLDNLYAPMNVPMKPVVPLPNAAQPGNAPGLSNQPSPVGRSSSGWQQRNNDAGRR